MFKFLYYVRQPKMLKKAFGALKKLPEQRLIHYPGTF
jgi:hypothetical protein